jgi:hypothetical protein
MRSWQKVYASIITTVSIVTLRTDRYNDRLLPLLRQLPLIPIRINKCFGSQSELFYSLVGIPSAGI